MDWDLFSFSVPPFQQLIVGLRNALAMVYEATRPLLNAPDVKEVRW
jgi:hypothetical protein